MKCVGRMQPQPWMTSPETRAVLAALRADGQEVRFVGGCVRDALLGRPIKDVDIATPDDPETVMALLRRAGLKAVPTGIDHGTVTAVSDHHPFEITTLREDVETYGRRARVAFTDNWTADAARRDFTMNAIFCAPDGTLYDAFGGCEDLRAGRVRFVGEPEQRIREDYLRLLRFFRFHAHYGRGAPDRAGLRAAAAFAGHLPELSGERVREELLRLLVAPDPAPVARVMDAHAILAAVLPEAVRGERLAALVALEPVAQVSADPILRLAAWLETDAAGAEAVADRLRFSRRERKWLAGLAAPPMRVDCQQSARDLRVALYRLGARHVRNLLLLDAAGRQAGGAAVDPRTFAEALAVVAAWRPTHLPVRGKDAQVLGLASGPRVGELLGDVERWWIEQDFAPGRAACLRKLKELVERLG